MNLTNLKCHTRLEDRDLATYRQGLQESEAVTKRTHSFAVLRLPPVVYTCFYSGFINVTGIRTFEQLRSVTTTLREHLGLDPEVDPVEPHIDSISSAWPQDQFLPGHQLNKVRDIALKESQVTGIKWNRQQFPALFLKTKFGTILWFNAPAIVSVGSKEKQDLTELKCITDRILQALSKT